MIIYKITNKVNHKIYIGQTICSLAKRWCSHKNRDLDTPLSRAIKKYGAENFSIENIQVCGSFIELDEAEQKWIALLGATDPDIGYNIETGGYYGHRQVSAFSRKKISERAKIRGFSPITAQKLSKKFLGPGNPFYGKSHTDHAKALISRANSGQNNGMFGRCRSQKERDNLSKKFLGKVRSLEDRKKMSENRPKRAIIATSLTTCISIHFVSGREAERQGFNRSMILKSLKSMMPYRGYIWKYE